MSRISLAQRLNYMVCNTACNLFLNNCKFSVKQILWPQTLPHTLPIFLWVTRGAASKPLLFLSLGRQPSAAPASVGQQAALLSAGISLSPWAVRVSVGRLLSLLRKFDLLFSKRF